MEYCSLDDAFPASMTASPGCRDSKPVREQARAERRRAKKCKSLQADYLADPDRPSLSSALEEPDAMQGSGAVSPFNSATGLYESGPLGSPNRADDEELVKAPKSAYTERKAPASTVNTKLTETSGPARLNSSAQKPPAYFGAGLDDDVEGFLDSPLITSLSHERMASFSPTTNNKDEFMMGPGDLRNLFQDKAAGASLPVPSVVDSWKRLTPSGAQSAYIDALPPPGGEYLIGSGGRADTLSVGSSGNRAMMQKLDKIFARLDDLEAARGGSENNHMEIFMFILSGMFVMFAMDSLARRR